MNNVLGQRILQLRKEKNYTQEQLSSKLNVTAQAVSKWEKGYSLPDTALLPLLAKVLQVSLDSLFRSNEVKSHYDTAYDQEDYFWGLGCSDLAKSIVLLMQDRLKERPLRLLEIGSGEGRDAVYFAQSGFVVDALEISLPGVEKIKKYSEKMGCLVNVIHADMLNYKIEECYDVIYSMGTLQFLPHNVRREYFSLLKNKTNINGINAHLIFVEKPFIAPAPDWQEDEYFYLSGDLANFYHDWEIVQSNEQIIDCQSSGVKHQHVVNNLLAVKNTEK